MLLRSSMPFLLLTFSEVLKHLTHYHVSLVVMLQGGGLHPSIPENCFLSDFFPFSLFSLEFWWSPPPDKIKISERTELNPLIFFCLLLYYLLALFSERFLPFNSFPELFLKLYFILFFGCTTWHVDLSSPAGDRTCTLFSGSTES